MKKILFFLLWMLSLSINAQQWNSETEINRYYDKKVREAQNETKEYRKSSDKIKRGIGNAVVQSTINHWEDERKKALATFRQNHKRNRQSTSKPEITQNEYSDEEYGQRVERERQREAYGNMVREQKLAELHAQNAGKRYRLSQLSEELEFMRANVNSANLKKEMLGDGNWTRVQADKTEPAAINLNINANLRRQINIGKMKVRDSIATDIDKYLLAHIGDVHNVPIDEYFCDYVKQKVLDYYHVDNMQFMWKQCDSLLEAEVIKTAQEYSVKANQMMRSNIDKCNNNKQAPTWEMLRNTMREKNGDKGIDRFISTINILSTSNAGVLPTPLGIDKNYYYYRLGYSQQIARISVKKPGMIEVVSCNYETRDLESLKLSMQGQSPMIPYVSLFEQGIGMKSYNVLPDGSAKGTIKDKSGNTFDYKVKAPHLEIYRSGEVVLRNTLDETYTSNNQYSNVDFSAELDFKFVSIKWKSNGEVTVKGKVDGIIEGEISAKSGNIAKVGGKEKKSPYSMDTKYDIDKKSIIYGGSYKVNGQSVDDITGEKMKEKIKGLVGDVKEGTLGFDYTASDKGSGIVVNGKIKNAVGGVGGKISRNISKNGDGSQHVKDQSSLSFEVADALKIEMGSSHEFDKTSLSSENNTYIEQLPSNLLTEIYSKKIEDFMANGTPMYSDFIIDNNDMITKYPLPQKEIEDIKRGLLDNAAKTSNQDFRYQPSRFNQFGTCFEVE